MSSELAIISPKSIEEAERLAKTLSVSQLLPDALKQKPQDVLAIVLTGAELGLAPMQAIRGIQVIKGKPTLAAETMGALVRRRSDVCEYLVLRESTTEKAVYETKRKGDPGPTTMAFTSHDAQRAGLNGDNWRKYPAAMLRARCLSAICKAVYSDLCLGLYDPDELAETPAPAAPVEKDVTPPTTTAPKTSAEAKKVLEAKLAIVNGTVAEPKALTPADRKAFYDRIVAIARECGLDEIGARAELKRLTGKTNAAQLTEEDVSTFGKWASSVAEEPPPPDQAPYPDEAGHDEMGAPF